MKMSYERKLEVPVHSGFHNDLYRVLSLYGGKPKKIPLNPDTSTKVLSSGNSKEEQIFQQFLDLFEWDKGVVIVRGTLVHARGEPISSNYKSAQSWSKPIKDEYFIGCYCPEFLQSANGQKTMKAIDTLIKKHTSPESAVELSDVCR